MTNKDTYTRLDVETQLPHQNITVGCDDGHIFKPNIFGINDFTTSLENCRR